MGGNPDGGGSMTRTVLLALTILALNPLSGVAADTSAFQERRIVELEVPPPGVT